MDNDRLIKLNKWLIIVLILLQPFVSIIKENLVNDIQVLGFSIFEIINISIILISLLITILLYNKKPHFYKFIILIPIFIAYCIFHYINLKNFNLSVYERANFNFFKETYYLFRMFMVPLLLIISLYYSGIKKDSCIRIVETYAFIISFIIVFSNILMIANPSYLINTRIHENIFSWFTFKSNNYYDYYNLASVGLFGSANQMSAVLFMTSPIVMYLAYKKRSAYNYLLLILHSVSMLMIGTKTANIGIILVYICFFMMYAFFKLKHNTHHSIKPIIFVFLFIFVLFLFSPISHKIRMKLNGAEPLTSLQKISIDSNLSNKEKTNVASNSSNKEKTNINSTIDNCDVELVENQEKLGDDIVSLYNEVKTYNCDKLDDNEKFNIKLLLNTENMHFLGLGEYIINSYKVDKHIKFWCDYVKNFDGINYRKLKTSIYKNIYDENNNKWDKWLGLGHTSYMIYTEADYTYQFFSYGIIGIVVLLGPYFLCILYLAYKILRYRKKYMNLENLMYLLGVVLAVIAAYFSGHVFETTLTLLTLSLLIGLNLINFHSKKVYKKKVLFISSTGGHLNELSQLKRIFNDYDYRVVTEKTKSTVGLKKEHGKRINYLIFGTKDHKFTYPFKFIYNTIKSLFIFLTFNPKVIITTGTHTAVPMCYIGKFFGSKIIFIETFANRETKTLAGRVVYPIADVFIVQWEEMLKLYPKAVYWGWIY